MNKTLYIFMYKGMACAHCMVRTGIFLHHPNTVNPPMTVVGVEHVSITKEAKQFIKNNHSVATGEFSFNNFLKEPTPNVKLYGTANIFVLSTEQNNAVLVGNSSDINVLDLCEEITDYTPPINITNIIDNNIGNFHEYRTT